MGGRPRTATNILEMRGAYKANPQRRKEREFEPIVTEPIGDPPKTFEGDVLQAWTDIVDTAPAGVLTKADRIWVELAAGLLARHRELPLRGSDLGQLTQLIGKCGMNPSERSKVQVSVPTKKPGNPFASIK